MKRITGSLVVCVSAGAFTAGALFYHPADRQVAPSPVVSSAVTPGANGTTLDISGFTFDSIIAQSGAVITIVNHDTAAHTVTADSGAFNAKVNGGSSVTFLAPTTVGTYTFFCAIHPEMHGTL